MAFVSSNTRLIDSLSLTRAKFHLSRAISFCKAVYEVQVQIIADDQMIAVEDKFSNTSTSFRKVGRFYQSIVAKQTSDYFRLLIIAVKTSLPTQAARRLFQMRVGKQVARQVHCRLPTVDWDSNHLSVPCVIGQPCAAWLNLARTWSFRMPKLRYFTDSRPPVPADVTAHSLLNSLLPPP